MIEELKKKFEKPGAEFRGKPFWSWNGRLEEAELRRQIRAMRRMGLGGFFMHSRVGLETSYLSPEWFDLVRACIDEARRLGMEPWLYDEDRWSSGTAGGKVTRDMRFRARTLAMVESRDSSGFSWNRDVLAAFVAQVEGSRARNLRPVARGKRPASLAPGESLLSFGVCVEECSSWYNGHTYLDTLNPKAVREFVRLTHEAYRRELSDSEWRALPGIFTDEPNYGRLMEKRKRVSWIRGEADARTVPWTAALPATFRRRYGYDLLARVPDLFFDLDDPRGLETRYHYYDCITHLFVDAFARQIGEWCSRNGIASTGHLLGEEPLSLQTWVVGSAMRFYEHMQLPGIDLLTEHEYEFATAKQVSSVARQFGRKWRLTETYGITGWDFPFLGQKAMGDWQVAMGINLRCQHLAFYTMLGEAKRDYPPSIFEQSPWWELYPTVEDYFARVLAAMTRGREVRDLLVIHPIESAWLRVNRDFTRFSPENREFDALFADAYGALLAENIDFDFGEEEILSRRGRIARDKGEVRLRVGRATYRAVVVPPMQTIRRTTLDLLRRFREAGGKVVFAGDPAPRIDAMPSDEVATFARRCVRAPRRGKRLARAVEAECRRVSIADPLGREIAPALHLLREDRDASYLFVCNSGYRPDRPIPKPLNTTMMRDRRAAFPDVRIRGFEGCRGRPLELDPATGAIHSAEAAQIGGEWEIRTSLPALGSRLFAIPKRGEGKRFSAKPRLCVVREEAISSPKAWEYSLSEPNCLVLDRPRLRIADEEQWRDPEEILRVDRAVRSALGIAPRGGIMVQPWARPKNPHPPSKTIELLYEFDVESAVSGDFALGIERPDLYEVRLNGHQVDPATDTGWWVDRSLRRIPLDPAQLRTGVNRLTLGTRYSENHPGLEIVYLLGRFGTRVVGTRCAIAAPPQTLRPGDWCGQGLAFYGGSVAYRRRLRIASRRDERIYVRVPEYRGAAFRVSVDGRIAGTVGWEPNEVEITDLVGNRGEIDLTIEIFGHRRNSHGPLHHAEREPYWVGPTQFTTKGNSWSDEYQLVACGMMKPPVLVFKRQERRESVSKTS
ncbi:hypothetical protein JW916_00650 [Candidatus Sumerlaeota bacterium]|nr:hypothetical protein [Candidatus Sumerlaeota bacterium]